MKNLNYLYLICILLIALVSNCSKCPDPKSGNTFNVNQDDLPYIIPYSDTSKVRFLKNGTDTVIFVSQGLKNTYIEQNQADGNCSSTNRIQQFSLMMKYNENEYFEIFDFASNVDLIINKVTWGSFSHVRFTSYYPLPILSYMINNTKYDSVKVFTNDESNDTLIFKPKVGLLKIKSTNLYEIIK